MGKMITIVILWITDWVFFQIAHTKNNYNSIAHFFKWLPLHLKNYLCCYSAIGVAAAEFIAEKDPFSAIALGRGLVTTLYSSDLW
jgi:hypothetical protein